MVAVRLESGHSEDTERDWVRVRRTGPTPVRFVFPGASHRVPDIVRFTEGSSGDQLVLNERGKEYLRIVGESIGPTGVSVTSVPYDPVMNVATNTAQFEALADVRARLAEFATYESDWDSYGAAPIAPAAITTASYLIHRVLQQTGREPFFVGPIPYGGIEVEYRGGEWRIDVDVRPDETFDVLLVRGQGVEAAREARSGVPLTDVLRLIGNVVGG